MKTSISLCLVTLLVFPVLLANAETKTIISEATYIMGDGETPDFAEARGLQKAKQSALEEAGTYVQSYTEVQNLNLSTDEIQTVAGGVLQVEVLEKTRTLISDGLRVYTKIKATVTTDKMEELARRIRGKNVVQEYKNLQSEYVRLSRELESLKQLAAKATADRERLVAHDRIKESEKDFARVQESETALFRRLEADALLFEQINNGDLKGVIQALKNGANPNAVEKERNKLQLSALGTLSVYAVFWKYGEDLQKTNIDIDARAVAIANALFTHGAKLSRNYDNEILFPPIANGWAKFAELLIKNGADPRNKIEGQTPMEWAIHYNQPKVVEVLKAHGIRNVDNKKALLIRFIRAAEQSDIAELNVVRHEGRIDPNEKNDRDQTALIAALRDPIYKEKQYRTVKLLLELGADPNVIGESLYTGVEGIPIHLAISMNLHTLNKPSGDSKRLATLVIKDLLKHGAKVAHRDSRGRTALHNAAKNDNIVAAEILIAQGATIMPRDNSGKTPLDYAESAAMIAFLKKHGATELNR